MKLLMPVRCSEEDMFGASALFAFEFANARSIFSFIDSFGIILRFLWPSLDCLPSAIIDWLSFIVSVILLFLSLAVIYDALSLIPRTS